MSKGSLYRFLDTNGDGTGTKNANGNYASTAESFMVAPAAGQVYTLERMIVHIRDTANPSADNYGDTAGALTNGIKPRVMDASGEILDLCDGITVKSNADWAYLCYDVGLSNFGSGNDFIDVRWTFAKAGAPLVLNGDDGQWFEVLLNDDLTGLIAHYFMVQGLWYTNNSYALYHRRY